MTNNKFDAKKELEKADKAETATSIVSKIIGAAGIVGDTVAPGSSIIAGAGELAFTQGMGRYIGKKREKVLSYLVEGLERLEKEVAGFKIKDIENNEHLASAILHVLPIALRSFKQQKLEALRNAILNIALGKKIEEDIDLIFLDYIDSFTSWHLKILDYFSDPQSWFQKRGQQIPDISGSAAAGLEIAFPDLAGKDSLYHQIVDDLVGKGLMLRGPYMTTMMTSSGVYSRRTTDFGVKFIEFIRSPLKN